jgi:hypothetical protein
MKKIKSFALLLGCTVPVATNFPHWLQPQVTKKQVDNFREGKLTPCCQLLAEVSGKKKEVPTLKHQVNL